MPNYVFPPRPKGKIRPNLLPKYEATRQWVAQRKFNGTRSPIRVTADRQVFVWGRHGEPHKQFIPSQSVIDQILALNLPEGKEIWLDGELLKNKTTDPNYKDRIVLFDIYWLGDDYHNLLLGNQIYEQMKRLEMLAEICRHPTVLEPTNGIALVVSNNIWMAETWDCDFATHFSEKVALDEIEGLFLRKKHNVVDNLGSREYETTWCLRCRKPHSGGNYEY